MIFHGSVTVTTYVCVEESAAVTVYVTGNVKSLAVTPLICAVVPILTLTPVVVKVPTSAVKSVSDGNVTNIVFVVSLIVPVVPTIENAVMAFSDDGVMFAVDPLLPHPLIKFSARIRITGSDINIFLVCIV